MADSIELAARTRFAARIVGPFMLVVGAVVIAKFETLMLMMPAMLSDTALMFITGIFTLLIGLILFAWHHHWRGAAAIVISLIGLLTMLRGVLLMIAPDFLAGLAAAAMSAAPGAMIAGAFAVLLGLWLTYVGWLTRS